MDPAVLDEVIPIVAIGCGTLIAIISVVMGSVKSMVKRREMEQSRRELAAYVAEGSITADDAERLLKAAPEED